MILVESLIIEYSIINGRIIIGFNDKNKKEEILSAFKSQFKTKPIIANEIHNSFPVRKIYLNH